MEAYKTTMPITPGKPAINITATEFTIKANILNIAVDFQ